MFLARKFTRAKWEPNQELSAGEISADAITADLRTKGNTLSFWQCGGGTKAEVENAALAIAAACQHVEKLDIVWVADDVLRIDGQSLRDTPGQTPVSDLVALHVDVCRLDYVRLGGVARRVIGAMTEQRWRRLTKRRVADILASAIRQGRVQLNDLHEGVREEIRVSL